MRMLIKSRSGVTFVETIIAFSIVGIFLALTWATISFLLLKTGEQIVQTRAHFLAVEGIEQVKQIRQTMINQNRLTGYSDSIGNRSENEVYVLGENEGLFTLKPRSEEPGSDGKILMDEEPYTDYCRTVEFKEGDEPDSKKVIVTVKWGNEEDCSKNNKLIAYSTYLTNMYK